MQTTTIILFMVFLFIVALFFKIKFKNVCALCAAVSLTWIFLLSSYFLGYEINTAIIILLMGTSVTGAYYYIEKKIIEEKKIFNFPIFLTLFIFAYQFWSSFNEYLYGVLLLIWIAFGALYYGRKNNRLKGIAKKVIACCKNW